MNDKKPRLFQNKRTKLFRSKSYNYTFDLRSGNFLRWGNEPKDDPDWSPFGPEILDIEVSEGAGCPMACSVCYKRNKMGNASTAVNMSFDTFKSIFNKMPCVTTKEGKKIFFLTQIAFGITSVNSNPDLFEMFDYCRENSVIPNVTINGADNLDDVTVQRLVDVCGAMAVSINESNLARGLDLIKRLIDCNAPQINIHYVLSEQSYVGAYTIIKAWKEDARLKGLNAIVFLGLKPMGRGAAYDVLPIEKYDELVKYCFENEVRFGFDSCSAPRFEQAIKKCNLSEDQMKLLMMCSDRCESGLFSSYIDCSGKYWHCSFGEDKEMAAGIDLTKADNFLKDVWLTEQVENWRWALIKLKRECPLYPEIHSTAK